MRHAIAAAILLAVSMVLIPVTASATPYAAWRTRNTGLDSEGACTRRAFKAMQTAGLGGQASGNLAVYGQNGPMVAYIVCVNGGRLAAIFCSSDHHANATSQTVAACDSLSRYMER